MSSPVSGAFVNDEMHEADVGRHGRFIFYYGSSFLAIYIPIQEAIHSGKPH